MVTKAPTMRDVARLAGVSVQTVSCVVNGKGDISDETRARVLDAIDRLDYRRDPIARSLRTRRTRLIALLVLDITNPVLSVIASAVEAAAYAQDYNVILHDVRMDADRERNYLQAAADGLIDGLIVVNALARAPTFALLQAGRVPAVLIDCLEETVNLPSVCVDNFQGAYLATAHAAALGHERIAHIAGAESHEIARLRTRGYLQALEDHGLGYRCVVATPTERWDYQAGYEAMRQLLRGDPHPTAVFAASDQMAIGAYRAIAEASLRVPGDISLIGFDDIDAAAYTAPPLTTVRQPFAELAGRAVALLLQIIGGDTPASTRVVLPPELVVRQSTARVT